MKHAYTVELRSSSVDVIDDEVMDAFAAALFRDRRLAGPAPAADLALRSLELRSGVDARSPADALKAASAGLLRAAKVAGYDVTIIEATVWIDTEDAGDRQELVSGAEVARRLGISRQRVQQLSSVGGRFPRATATFGTVSAWRWGDVADWARMNRRGIVTLRRRKTA